MEVKELSDRLAIALEGVAEEERDAFIRGWIKNLPTDEQQAATAIYGIFSNTAPPKSKHVLVLVHGIRTAAVWHDLVQKVFEPTEIRVIPIGYEYYDVVRFLWPFGRNRVVRYVQDQLRQVRADFPQAAISLMPCRSWWVRTPSLRACAKSEISGSSIGPPLAAGIALRERFKAA
ncbi:MAG: hypothetical protein KF686_03235 [Ramlibacter sp.]|nr:hypothetical protein [Ramlibacter sp.]